MSKELRYTGKHHWTRTVLTEEGKFKKFEMVPPGATVTFDDDVADHFLQGPRASRLWVQAGSSEDPASKDYVPSKWDGHYETGMYVSPDPGLEMGSTVPEGRTITRTEDENPEGYPIAGPNEGPQSDNEALYEEDEIQAAAEEARGKAREARSSRRSTSADRDSGPATASSPTPSPSSGRGERSERGR